MFSLTGGLSQEPVVLDTALHGLIPVDSAIISTSTVVIIATGLVITLSVAIPIIRTADTSTTSSCKENDLMSKGGDYLQYPQANFRCP